MNPIEDDNDRFGVPLTALQAALSAHEGIIRAGLYIPTRQEVATWPTEKLYSVLLDWMWESPSEIIPSSANIAAVLAVLEKRPDVDQLTKGLYARTPEISVNHFHPPSYSSQYNPLASFLTLMSSTTQLRRSAMLLISCNKSSICSFKFASLL